MRFLSTSASLVLLLLAIAMSGCGMATTGDADSGPAAPDGGASDAGSLDAGATDTGTDAFVPPGQDAGVDAFVAHDGGTRVPMYHRPDDSQCSAAAPAGNCSFGGGGGGGMCTNDAACTDGTNGRCVQSIGGAIFCSCSYDTCTHDTDCPTGSACACHGAQYHERGNECLPGNCRVDSDCGVNGYCSPTIGGCGSLQGYYCHTVNDTCIDDTDCTGAGVPQICQYKLDTARWQCVEQLLCG